MSQRIGGIQKTSYVEAKNQWAITFRFAYRQYHTHDFYFDAYRYLARDEKESSNDIIIPVQHQKLSSQRRRLEHLCSPPCCFFSVGVQPPTWPEPR